MVKPITIAVTICLPETKSLGFESVMTFPGGCAVVVVRAFSEDDAGTVSRFVIRDIAKSSVTQHVGKHFVKPKQKDSIIKG